MKNITVSLDDEVYRQARIRAAERQTSVSALVRGYLMRLSTEEADTPEARFARGQRLEDEILAKIKGISMTTGDRMSRDEMHDRRWFR